MPGKLILGSLKLLSLGKKRKRQAKQKKLERRRAAFAAAVRRQLRKQGHKPENATIIKSAIRDAAIDGTRLKIRYVAKYNERPLYHIITPYEIKTKRGRGPYLYADDHTGGTRGIHSFLTHRILTAKPTKTFAEPEWPVKLVKKDRKTKRTVLRHKLFS
jgi:predicted DNA-binding transcriptional regulator YafY